MITPATDQGYYISLIGTLSVKNDSFSCKGGGSGSARLINVLCKLTAGRIHLTQSGQNIIRTCIIMIWDEKEEPSRELALEEIDVKNFEVLSFDEETEQNGYKLTLCGEMDTRLEDAKYAFIEMVIHYSSSRDMFNELAGESWFESESFK